MLSPSSAGSVTGNTDEAKFVTVCELFETMMVCYSKQKGAAKRQALIKTASKWFSRFQSGSLFTLFRLLVPSEDHYRVYHIKETRLASLLCEALSLKGTSRGNFLMNWRRDERHGASQGDLAQILFAIMKNECASKVPTVKVREVDAFLDFLVNSKDTRGSIVTVNRDIVIPELRQLLIRMTAAEAKWLVRIILKDLHLPFDYWNFFKGFHPNFYKLFQLQRDLVTACESVGKLIAAGPGSSIYTFLKPKLGVCIEGMQCGRGTGINQVAKRMKSKTCYVETKYDGERLQAHINLEWAERIRIFSKSGRDSTSVRFRSHQQLLEAIDAQNAIIEGELLVYNERRGGVESFGTVQDLGPNSTRFGILDGDRHFLVMLYDIINLNGICLTGKPYWERRQILESVVKVRPNYVELSTFEIINFSTDPTGKSLARIFKECLQKNEEGLIIKDANSRYFPGDRSNWLKLKKDYIEGFGDTAEFAIVGASVNPDKPGLYSDFTVAVLREEVESMEVIEGVPRLLGVFRVLLGLSEVELKLLQPVLKELSCHSTTNYILEYATGFTHRPDILVSTPLVVELLGSGFVKERGQPHWTLRFPRIKKIFVNRPLGDVLSFNELQQLGDNTVVDEDCDELMKGQVARRGHKIHGDHLDLTAGNVLADNVQEDIHHVIPTSDGDFEPINRQFTDTQDSTILASDSLPNDNQYALIPYLLEDYRHVLEPKLRSMGYLIVHTCEALISCEGHKIVVVDSGMPWIKRRLQKNLNKATAIEYIEMAILTV